jgi:hypothetical protein
MNRNKKFWVMMVVLVLVLAGIVVGLVVSSRHRSTAPEANTVGSVANQAEGLGIQNFSVQGRVDKVEDNKLYLLVDSVQNSGQGNQVATTQVTVTLSDQTAFLDNTQPGSILTASNLTPGQNVTVYTTDNPVNHTQISATSILLNN